MTRAQMEARRRELERQREEQRRRQVKQQVMQAAADIERELLNLASDGQAAWVHEEVAASRPLSRVLNRHQRTATSILFSKKFNTSEQNDAT